MTNNTNTRNTRPAVKTASTVPAIPVASFEIDLIRKWSPQMLGKALKATRFAFEKLDPTTPSYENAKLKLEALELVAKERAEAKLAPKPVEPKPELKVVPRKCGYCGKVHMLNVPIDHELDMPPISEPKPVKKTKLVKETKKVDAPKKPVKLTVVPVAKTRFDHTNCSHPRTPAGRATCRRVHADAAAKKATKK